MRRHAIINVLNLGLATLGALMLLVAYLRWVDYPLTLWTKLP